MKATIFVVDDEPKIGQLFCTVLRRDGYRAESFLSPVAMFEAIERGQMPDLVLADLLMPDMSGLELIERLRQINDSVPVIIMTAHSSVQTAVEAMRLGAFHYLSKPINLEEMRALVQKALEVYAFRRELVEVRREHEVRYGLDALIGSSPPIQQVRATLERLRYVSNSTVLLRGETGTGKNLVARIIHHIGPRNKGRFLEINCAAVPDNLLEAELFGYEKGAFTDARQAKPGLLEQADGGTVFLDEIDSLSPALQAKLLSFLETRTFRRLGGLEDISVDTRVIAATNTDLEQKVAEKTFRKDLYYRLNVISITLPPLRAMGRDVLAIAQAFIAHYNRELGKQIRGLTEAAEDRLLAHSWPGNVRELRNVIERAMIFAQSAYLGPEDLVLGEEPAGVGALQDEHIFCFPSGGTLEELEKAYIKHILRTVRGSYAEVAEILGISKKTLWEKRKRYGLDEAGNLVRV
jgi:two-component system response regulator AtoC